MEYTPQPKSKSKELYNLAIGITTTTEKKNIDDGINAEDIEFYNIYDDHLNTTLEQIAFHTPKIKTKKTKRLKKLLDKIINKNIIKKTKVSESIISTNHKESPAKNRKESPKKNSIINENKNDKQQQKSLSFPINFNQCYLSFRILFSNNKLGIFIPIIGLCCAFIIETIYSYHNSFRGYNVPILLTLLAATGFHLFPLKTARPQIALTLVTVLTISIDILSMIWQSSKPMIIVLKIIIILSKVYALQDFLRNGKGTRKAREILARKLRVFLCTCSVPSNIIKEVRMRIVSIGWLHLISTTIYGMILLLLLLQLLLQLL